EAVPQVFGGQAVEGVLQQGLVQGLPIHEGREDAVFFPVAAADAVAVGAALQLRQAALEQRRASAVEVGFVEVRRAAVEWMEESPRQRREDCLPAEQAEQ